jgi:hypothetical protein
MLPESFTLVREGMSTIRKGIALVSRTQGGRVLSREARLTGVQALKVKV